LKIHPEHFLDDRPHDDQTRSLDLIELPQEEDHATLVLHEDLDTVVDHGGYEN
jgi:hypothetical protein